MLKPLYTVTPRLLQNIKQIAVLINTLNQQAVSDVVRVDFEMRANSLSTFASTSIEGNPLPLTAVKQLLKSKPQNQRDTEREVLNYNTILEKLNLQIKQGSIKLTSKLVCEVQKTVTLGLIEKFRCGKLRNEPVFVNDPKSGKPVFLPPDHQDVVSLLQDLITFAEKQRGALDPLIVAGIFHKQFVIIHPFVDGNGRTARLLTKTLLADMGLNTFNLFSFENYYNRNVAKYFKTVGVFGNYYEIANNIDFTDWLEYFTDGILDELLRVQKELESVYKTPNNVLTKHHQKITERAKATRALDFHKLVQIGIIERCGQGPATYYRLISK